MKRTALLVSLEQIAPALASNDLIPVLTHFNFTGKDVVAYNDQIGLSTALKTEFKGAVPGALLLNLLKASRAENITFEDNNDELVIKAASAVFRLNVMPEDAFIFKMPKPKEAGEFTALDKDHDFIKGIEACMRSVGTDTSVPDYLGITLIPGNGEVSMFSTNDNTLSHARVKLPKGTGKFTKRIILSTPFCEQLLKLASYEKPRLELYPDHALMTAGDTTLFGRLIVSDEQPFEFPDMLAKSLPKDFNSAAVKIPTKLELILDRAVIITEAERASTEISCHGGTTMKFFSKSSYADVSDSTLVENHPDVEVRLDAKLLKAGFGHFDKMLITKRCAIMVRGDTYYLVASR